MRQGGGGPGDPVTVVYLTDRAQRLALDRTLRAAGLTVRLASRPAELAKALADGRARAVICDPHTRVQIGAVLAGSTSPDPQLLVISADVAADEILTQLRGVVG